MKPTAFVIELKPYPFDVLFSFNQNDTQFNHQLNKLGVKEFSDPSFYDPVCRARTINLETGATIVRFKDFNKNAINYGLLSHEIFHVVEFIFDRIGMPHSVEYSSEAYAYQIQHITEVVYEMLGVK
jgi:hypothetical protein